MACYRPLHAWKSLSRKTENGKSVIVFDKGQVANEPYEKLELPCGQCLGCRLQRSKDWAIRCVHEASLWEKNCFITLTFDDEHLDISHSLVKSDFQKFMKRLRKDHHGYESRTAGNGKKRWPIRYYHCGEYGSINKRPHHHACLFNWRPGDLELWSIRSGVRLYRSAELERLWPFGFCTVGDVTCESAAYVARYVLKKINGDKAKEHYWSVDAVTGECNQIEPEYTTMSRRPGIGYDWFVQNVGDVFPKDFCTWKGKKFRSPRYYDHIYDSMEDNCMAKVKSVRKRRAIEHKEDSFRLKQIEKCKQRRIKRLVRSV